PAVEVVAVLLDAGAGDADLDGGEGASVRGSFHDGGGPFHVGASSGARAARSYGPPAVRLRGGRPRGPPLPRRRRVRLVGGVHPGVPLGVPPSVRPNVPSGATGTIFARRPRKPPTRPPMPDSPRVAYFCMEYGLDDRLKTYSGGLGILAGDTLKAAHDLGAPMVGVGIRWQQGSPRQLIDPDGEQVDACRNYAVDGLLEDTGVEVSVRIKGADVRCRVWKADRFGNVPLYLLDTDLPDNPEAMTTGQLYGWFGEERVAQEVVLGVGGVRALRALGIGVDVYHFNEGHALLAAFELMREKVARGMCFDEARAATRGEVVFTTHTPVLAGNESHPIERLRYVGAAEGFTDEQLVALRGRPFNMTVAALRLSRRANAVPRRHRAPAHPTRPSGEHRPA